MWTFAIVVVSIIAFVGFFKWHRANQDPLQLMANNNQKMWVENHKSELSMDNYFSDDDHLERLTSLRYSWSYGNSNYEEDNYLFKDDFSKF